MKLYIIRHGETSWNVERRLQGASDTDLNENGIALAAITGAAMKEIPFDCCFSSPLKRARETARLVLAGRNIPVTEDERLREISFGEWEGRIPPFCRLQCLIISFIIQKNTCRPKAEKPLKKSVQELLIFFRILQKEKNCRIRPF